MDAPTEAVKGSARGGGTGAGRRWSPGAATAVVSFVAGALLIQALLRVVAVHNFPVVPDGDVALLRYRTTPGVVGPATFTLLSLLLVALAVSRLRSMRIALSLLLAGSLSNNAERWLTGRVTTYLRPSPGLPVMNLADLLISVGVLLAGYLLAARLLHWMRRKSASAPS